MATSVIPRTAHFDAEYDIGPERPGQTCDGTDVDDRSAAPAAIIARPAERIPRNTPVWLTAMVRSHCSSVSLTSRAPSKMPAFIDEDVDAAFGGHHVGEDRVPLLLRNDVEVEVATVDLLGGLFAVVDDICEHDSCAGLGA